MKVIIMTNDEGDKIVGSIEDWQGPLPSRGDYIEHPPFGKSGMPHVMSVKVVQFRMLTRPGEIQGAVHFIAHPEPQVEIWV